jgi:hypothetical protein
MVTVEEQKIGARLGTLCVLWDDLWMKPRRGKTSSPLYKVVKGGPTATQGALG